MEDEFEQNRDVVFKRKTDSCLKTVEKDQSLVVRSNLNQSENHQSKQGL